MRISACPTDWTASESTCACFKAVEFNSAGTAAEEAFHTIGVLCIDEDPVAYPATIHGTDEETAITAVRRNQ